MDRFETHDETTGSRGERLSRSGWQWDEARGEWLRPTGDHELAEIVLEDFGGTSVLRRIATTLTGQYGTFTYRFVARGTSSHDATVDVAVSGTFPVQPLQLPLDGLQPGDAWADEIIDRFHELERDLEEAGWYRTGQGAHWWSRTYARDRVDAARSHAPDQRETASADGSPSG